MDQPRGYVNRTSMAMSTARMAMSNKYGSTAQVWMSEGGAGFLASSGI